MKTAAWVAAVLFGSLIGDSAIGAEIQAADVPAVIQAGFDRYAVEGAYAAAHTWISGGPLFDDPEALLGTVNLLKSIEKRYGAYLGFRVLQIEKISDATRVIRTEIRYELVGRKLYVFSLIDNLLKGAASHAVENFNRLNDFPLATALIESEGAL